MKKTVRFIALIGIIACAWMSAEAPSQAAVNCVDMPETCTPGTKARCYYPQYAEWSYCLCPDGYWECY